jgi:hypothetical protein
VGEAQDRGPGLDLAAGAVAADEAVALEARHEARGGALRQLGGESEVADAERLVRVEHEGEQLRGPVDRLRALGRVGAIHLLELLFHAL